MSDFLDPIPEGLLETAYFAGKAFNAAFANRKISGDVLVVDRAFEMLATGVGCDCAESPKEVSVAMLLQFHGPQNVVPLLYQKPDGGLCLDRESKPAVYREKVPA